jgi:hypothetical protein
MSIEEVERAYLLIIPGIVFIALLRLPDRKPFRPMLGIGVAFLTILLGLAVLWFDVILGQPWPGLLSVLRFEVVSNGRGSGLIAAGYGVMAYSVYELMFKRRKGNG